MNKTIFIVVSIVIILCIISSYKNTESYKSISSQDAHQGVAVDRSYIYVINNKSISKYDKDDFRLADRWVASESSPIKHLNGGRVEGKYLICTHNPKKSNSIEIFKTTTMEHIESIPIKISGSLTWTYIDDTNDELYGLIAHYKNNADETRLVRFDEKYQIEREWKLPQKVLDDIKPWSLSGGFIYNGFIYCSGHDKSEVYKLQIDGSELNLIDILPTFGKGQGMDYDEKYLYTIRREQKKVIIAEFDA